MKHKFSFSSEVIPGLDGAIRCDTCHVAVGYTDQRVEACNAEPPTATAVQYGTITAPSPSFIERLDKLEPQIADHERRLTGNSNRVRDIAQEMLTNLAELRRQVAEMRTELDREQKYRASLALRVAQLESLRGQAPNPDLPRPPGWG